jgi:hypothetical protein
MPDAACLAPTTIFILGDAMTKEKFLTVRWNNLLSLGLGLPTLVYVAVASVTSFWSERGGLIGLAAIGVLY